MFGGINTYNDKLFGLFRNVQPFIFCRTSSQIWSIPNTDGVTKPLYTYPMETLAIFNRENVTEEELKTFRTRRAIRGVIFDRGNNIALLHQTEKGWYAIPGGGVEDGETFEQGIIRECKEEIGCDIEIVENLGTTLEYRKSRNSINESQGFIASVVGDKGSPIADDETSDSDIIWVSMAEAVRFMENTPIQEEFYDQYCIERDLAFLKKAQELIK